MSYDPHTTSDPYDDWEVGDGPEDAEYLGVLAAGMPLYYHEPSDELYEGYANEEMERLRLERNETYDIGADDVLGAVLEEIGEDLGWESLSEYARTHFDPDEPLDAEESS